MSLLEGCQSVTVKEFNGSKPTLDLFDITAGDAVLSYNSKYFPGRAQTREGTTPVDLTANNNWTSPFYWAQGQSGSPTHYLAYMRDFGASGRIYLRNLATNVEYNLATLPTTALAVSFVSSGQRLYAAAMSGLFATGQGYVWDGNVAHTMDATFQRPMKAAEVTLALTQPGSGVCTAGAHNVGVLFQTRSGYWTRPGPVDSTLVLQPQTITSTGTNNIVATLTPVSTWPSWIANIQLIYTSTLNDFQYYVVPGTITPVTAGGSGAVTATIDVADLQIRSIGSQGAGTLADDYFSLLSMDASNSPPFNVRFVTQWGNRLVWCGNYGGIDSLFVSDQLNPEWISADQHLLQLPSGLPIGGAFAMNGIFYVISSAGGMFAFTDNGGRPATFQPPHIVDGKVSVVSPFSVTVAANGGYAFIAAQQGLFVYSSGVFPTVPLSYYQTPDWIAQVFDPSVGMTPCVKDFPQESIVIVQNGESAGVPGGGKSLVFNYQNGMTPDKIRYSLWYSHSGGSGFGGFNPGTEIVYSPTRLCWEYWGYNGVGMHRMKSKRAGDAVATMYTDVDLDTTTHGIDWQYQASYLPSASGEIFNHLAVRLRAASLQSTGLLSVSVKNIDGTITVTPVVSPIAITSTPGKKYHMFYDLQGEVASYLFTNGATVANGVMVSEFTHYFNLMAEQR